MAIHSATKVVGFLAITNHKITMEITINVSNEQFKNVLEKELAAFNEDELKEICRKGLIAQLSDPNVFARLFVKEADRYNSYVRASDLLIEASRTVNFDETFKKMQDDIVDYIKQNYGMLLHDMCVDALISGFSKHILWNENFSERLRNEMISLRNESE